MNLDHVKKMRAIAERLDMKDGDTVSEYIREINPFDIMKLCNLYIAADNECKGLAMEVMDLTFRCKCVKKTEKS